MRLRDSGCVVVLWMSVQAGCAAPPRPAPAPVVRAPATETPSAPAPHVQAPAPIEGAAIGTLVYASRDVEALFCGSEAQAPESCLPNVIVREGASRAIVDRTAGYTLLEVIAADLRAKRDRGLAWVPNAALQVEPVTALETPVEVGELAYLGAKSIDPSGARTRCGFHRILERRGNPDEGEQTKISQLEAGVELIGWTSWSLEPLEIVDCAPHVVLYKATDERAAGEELLVLDELDHGRAFRKLLATQPTLYVLSANDGEPRCEPVKVSKTDEGYTLWSPMQVKYGKSWRYGEIIAPQSDPKLFAINQTGEHTDVAGHRTVSHFRCDHTIAVVELTDEQILTVAASRQSKREPLSPYAVNRAATRGWFRTLEACGEKLAAYQRMLHDPEHVADLPHALTGGGC